MAGLPTGTVTFLFTDIEGSTRLLQELGGAEYGELQDRHAAIMRAAIASGEGVEIRTEGDSFFAVFPTPSGAVRAAVDAQRALAEHPWVEDRRIRVRMGLHTGEGVPGGDDYLGIDVNRAARIAAAGHGGQVVVSDATRMLAMASLPEDVSFRDLGLHRLKDIHQPEHLHDLVVDGMAAEFPALRSLEARRTNLPAPRTSFVGRDREIAEVDGLLDDTRLLTLTGPGGTGKTRIALEVASGRLDRHADGVYFVDLSAVVESGVVITEIAGTLRVRTMPGRDVVTSLHEHLQTRELLLVLDNLEQLIEAAPAVGALLDVAPSLTVLTTSRIPLHLSGEQEYRVSPLALPERDGSADVDRLRTCESVRLFVERAAAVRPGFHITAETAPRVGEIVARLDGLPLALELAASRLRVLDLEALATRLEHRLPLLTGGSRDSPERQRTLEATIRWSHELLEPGRQRLLARLSVFAGGWTLEAAEDVCGPDLDVLDGLGTLVDDSLVRRTELAGDLRFTMLETIREFAMARLEEADVGERESVRRRHAEYYRDLAERAQPYLTRESQMTWLEILDRENDNMRAALDRAERAERPDDVRTGLRLAAALWRFWQLRMQLREGRAKLERLLRLPGAQDRDATRCRALGALGSIAYWQKDYEHVAPPYEEAEAIARELGDARLLSWALYDGSFVWLVVKVQPEVGGEMLRESLRVAEEDDLYLKGQIWTAIAYLRIFTGDVPGATEALETGLALHRTTGDSLFVAEALIGLAGAAFAAGDLDAVRERLAVANQAVLESAHPVSLAGVLHANAWLANHEGRHRQAVQMAGAYQRLGEDYGAHIPEVGATFFGDPVQTAEKVLGTEATERAHAEGLAMDLEAIMALVAANVA